FPRDAAELTPTTVSTTLTAVRIRSALTSVAGFRALRAEIGAKGTLLPTELKCTGRRATRRHATCAQDAAQSDAAHDVVMARIVDLAHTGANAVGSVARVVA